MSIDEIFAEVVNGITFGGRRPQRSGGGDDPPTQPLPPDLARYGPGHFTLDQALDVEGLAVDAGTGEDASIVRPYSWTRGRTRSSVDLRIEALVSTSDRGANLNAVAQAEHRAVAELCREPRSVAEVATLLGVPLGVAKVLVGDMASLGLVIVHRTATGGSNKAHLLLMERVLSGLRRL
ncbi:DUF742 domain-containing protein [Actinophytocola sp.]|uniref:DUF742 domain-containing protein n=1 Tax=Actinophytocola sp. TaxID=1872138 RepID=UPI002D7F9348|nr:DUF742 domain-containing protein [Actinophytocola sp.]HET9140140.1 DUF742 domain-containing protein [Actinophytocola sp.]